MRLLALIAVVAAALWAPPGRTRAAEAQDSWDGTWVGGWENGRPDGFQIIVVGGRVIGFYADAGYDSVDDRVERGELVIEFGTPRQLLRLKRTGADTATGMHRNGAGGPRSIEFQRD